jgi:hypothetical protein
MVPCSTILKHHNPEVSITSINRHQQLEKVQWNMEYEKKTQRPRPSR